MTTIQMEYFLEAARCLNFTTAAEHLYVTQPALSKQIQNLERQLDAKLFVRESNTVELTPIGKALFQELSPIYESYLLMLRRLENIQQGISGQLDIAIMEDQQMNQELISAVQNLLTRYPNVKINLSHMELRRMHNGLLNGDIDFALELHHFEAHMPQFSFLEIENDPEWLVVPKSVDLKALDIRRPEDYFRLADVIPCIMLKEENFETPVRDYLQRLIQHRQYSFAVHQKIRYVSSIGAIPLLVVAGLGFTIANTTYVLCNDPNVVFLPGKPEERISKGLFWNKSNQNPLVPIFTKLMRQELQKRSKPEATRG